MNKKAYITTPIYYANGSPHIGHFLTTTIADVLARYYRVVYGESNVFFTTGLDEHGTSVEKAALKDGSFEEDVLQKYVDDRTIEWKKAFDDTSISYDYFVRTTNPTHKKFAQNFIRTMVKKGDVYKGTYTGKYCNGCEKFLALSDLNDEQLCPLHKPEQVIEIQEQNYFFKLAEYAPKVAQLIKDDVIEVRPESKKHEMLARIELGVDDLSISRPKEKVSWGVEFPEDQDQVIYIWVEALINYLSSLEIHGKQDFWQVSTHLLGKDINWFHTVIWPALLLSAEYTVPKTNYVHSFLNLSGKKISKSIGNTITPGDLVKKYGIEGARFLILIHNPYKNDLDVTWDVLDEKYNGFLANGLGNLTARLTKMAENSGLSFNIATVDKKELFHEEWAKHLRDFKPEASLQAIWQKIAEIDKHINTAEPWKITDQDMLKQTLEQDLNKLYLIGLMIEPFLPHTSEKITGALEAASGERVVALKGLFPRI